MIICSILFVLFLQVLFFSYLHLGVFSGCNCFCKLKLQKSLETPSILVPTICYALKGNVDMTKNVLETAAHTPTIQRVLITSSMAATGYAEFGSEVDENSPLRPIEPYGDSKVAQEALAKEYADRVPSTIVRPPGVYGPRDTEIFAFFKFVNGGISPIMGLKAKEVSLIHVRDLVQGMYLAATNEKSVGQIYFLGSLERYDWKQLGEVASKVLNKKTWTIKIPHFVIFILGFLGQIMESCFGMDVVLNKDRAYRISRPSWYCSSAKAARELGFKQTVSIEEGFKTTVDWYKEQGVVEIEILCFLSYNIKNTFYF